MLERIVTRIQRMSMAYDLDKLENRCEELSATLITHILLILAYPSQSTTNHQHWLGEIRSYLRKLSFKTKSKSKQNIVRRWIARVSLKDMYEELSEHMEGNAPELSLRAIEDQANKALDTMAEHISTNNNNKGEIQNYPHTRVIAEWLGIEHP